VAVTDGRTQPDDRTFVVVQGFRSWIEPFEMQRFALIASVLRARLIVVEVPGFGVAGSRLLPRERRALLVGDFGPLAARMLDAACSVLGEADHGEPLSFLGYSMGASVASAMAKTVVGQGRAVADLVFVEPVAWHRWKVRELIAATRREDRWIADYVAANDAVDGATAPWDQRRDVRPPTNRRVDLALLAMALRYGRLARDLESSPTIARRVIVVRGDRSALSAARYGSVLAELHRRGTATAELTVPGHHAFWHSLEAVDDMARQLKQVLDDLH
jgi:pimeloyl-ACP methyl ester carboxylesterase